MMNFVLAWRVQRIKRTKWNLLSGHLNTGWRERWLFHLIIQLPSHRSSEFTQHEGGLLDWQIITCFEASAPPGGPALVYRDNNNNNNNNYYLNDYWKRRWRIDGEYWRHWSGPVASLRGGRFVQAADDAQGLRPDLNQRK